MATNPTKAPGTLSKAIAAKIKAARIEAGMSQEALALELGVTCQQVQKYERGLNRIAPDRLQQVAAMTGRPILYFFQEGPVQPAADLGEIFEEVILWTMSCPSARRVLAAVSRLNEEDTSLMATVVERLALGQK